MKPTRIINKWDHNYMEIATLLGTMSNCAAKGVGCVLVKDNNIVASGVNGTPPGYINCNELYHKHEDVWYGQSGSGKTDPTHPHFHEILEGDVTHKDFSTLYEVHAEINALSKMNRLGISCAATDLYVNYCPCMQCCKTIIVSRVQRVFYKHDFDDTNQSVAYLQANGIEVYKL